MQTPFAKYRGQVTIDTRSGEEFRHVYQTTRQISDRLHRFPAAHRRCRADPAYNPTRASFPPARSRGPQRKKSHTPCLEINGYQQKFTEINQEITRNPVADPGGGCMGSLVPRPFEGPGYEASAWGAIAPPLG